MKRLIPRLALMGVLSMPLAAITISCNGLSDVFDDLSDAFDDDRSDLDDFFDDVEDIFD